MESAPELTCCVLGRDVWVTGTASGAQQEPRNQPEREDCPQRLTVRVKPPRGWRPTGGPNAHKHTTGELGPRPAQRVGDPETAAATEFRIGWGRCRSGLAMGLSRSECKVAMSGGSCVHLATRVTRANADELVGPAVRGPRPHFGPHPSGPPPGPAVLRGHVRPCAQVVSVCVGGFVSGLANPRTDGGTSLTFSHTGKICRKTLRGSVRLSVRARLGSGTACDCLLPLRSPIFHLQNFLIYIIYCFVLSCYIFTLLYVDTGHVS